MDSRCIKCDNRCVPKSVCINCLDSAKTDIFKLDLTDKTTICIKESDFQCRRMITDDNPSKSKIYYYVTSAGRHGQHTVIVIPHNGDDVDEVWLNDDYNTPVRRNMRDDISE